MICNYLFTLEITMIDGEMTTTAKSGVTTFYLKINWIIIGLSLGIHTFTTCSHIKLLFSVYNYM